MILITWVTELINQLPVLLDNIMYGFVFIFIYRWITHKDNGVSKYTLIESIIVNYILMYFYKRIPTVGVFSIINGNRMIMYLILSFILGLAFGAIIYSESYNEILRDLHFKRNTRNTLWEDVVKAGTWIRVYTEDPDIGYLGCVKNLDDKKDDPRILLCKYQIIDSYGNVVADYSDDENEYVIISSKSFDRIEVSYTQSAKPCLYYRIKKKLKK